MQLHELKTQIKEHYSKADLENLQLGLTWYERAHNECKLLSMTFGVPLSKVVGVVAALSPNNKWQRNLHDAWDFLDKPSLDTKVCTFTNQRKKALAILESDGENETIEGILKGTKTRNFFHNILNFKTSNRVTVDIWAYRSVSLEEKQKNYKIVSQAYSEVATEYKLKPHQLQAVVWGVVRGKIA